MELVEFISPYGHLGWALELDVDLVYLGALEKPSKNVLGGVGLVFSLAVPEKGDQSWGCLCIQGSA